MVTAQNLLLSGQQLRSSREARRLSQTPRSLYPLLTWSALQVIFMLLGARHKLSDFKARHRPRRLVRGPRIIRVLLEFLINVIPLVA